MAVRRIDNLLIVVADLDAAIAFFVELGLRLEARAPLSGEAVERIIGLTGVAEEGAWLSVPGVDTKIELACFRTPEPIVPVPYPAPVNTLGVHHAMFEVDDLEDVVARLRKRHGAQLVGEIVTFGEQHRLCYLRSAEGFVVALAQAL